MHGAYAVDPALKHTVDLGQLDIYKILSNFLDF